MVKAPMAQEFVEPNPTKRRKKYEQTKSSRRRAWNPAIPCRERSPKTFFKTPEADSGSHFGKTATTGEEGTKAASVCR